MALVRGDPAKMAALGKELLRGWEESRAAMLKAQNLLQGAVGFGDWADSEAVATLETFNQLWSGLRAYEQQLEIAAMTAFSKSQHYGQGR